MEEEITEIIKKYKDDTKLSIQEKEEIQKIIKNLNEFQEEITELTIQEIDELLLMKPATRVKGWKRVKKNNIWVFNKNKKY
jgi:hypothetical protein